MLVIDVQARLQPMIIVLAIVRFFSTQFVTNQLCSTEDYQTFDNLTLADSTHQ